MPSSEFPPTNPNEHASLTVVTEVQQTFQGPLPAPHLMKAYEQAIPGAGPIILEMATKEQAHRHKLERVKLSADFVPQLLGLLFAAGIAGGGIYFAWDLFSKGHTVGGGAVLVTSLAGIIIGLVQAIRVVRMDREDLTRIELPAPEQKTRNKPRAENPKPRKRK